MKMVNSNKSCEAPQTSADKTWTYSEYYIGEKDHEDSKDGYGRYHWSGAESLECYEGCFVRNTMHGIGEYRCRHRGPENLDVTYEGHFYNNNMHGYGIMSYADGRVFSEMKVLTPPGDYVGRIQQQCTWIVPFFLVRDVNDLVLFVIEGPATFRRRSLVQFEFKILTGDYLREVGRIVHAWDQQLVSFTTSLEIPNSAVQPKHKALLLGATFLLEYTYFVRSKTSCNLCCC